MSGPIFIIVNIVVFFAMYDSPIWVRALSACFVGAVISAPFIIFSKNNGDNSDWLCAKCKKWNSVSDVTCNFCGFEKGERQSSHYSHIESKKYTESQYKDAIFETYNKKEYSQCKLLLQGIMQDCPESPYINFIAKDRLKEVSEKIKVS
jgi:hypothetical protein